jgi:hypothetical protein
MREFWINYKPHKKQLEVHKSKKRFKVINAGRQSGKTYMSGVELLRYCLNNPPVKGKPIAWISPSYRQSSRGAEVFNIIDPDNIIHKRRGVAPIIMDIVTGHQIYFFSADNAESLRGWTFSAIVIDEADMISTDIWENIIRPTIAITQAPGVIISTPRNKQSYFHKMWLAGQDKNNTEIESFHFTSLDNPYMPITEFERAKLELPEIVFKQEWLAEFPDDKGSVFANLSKCFVDTHCDCKEPVNLLGVDLAKSTDYTSLINLCPYCMHVKDIYRDNKIDWDIQQEILLKKWEEYSSMGNTITIMDANGVGNVVFDNLKNRGMNIIPFTFTNTSKIRLIGDLRAKIATNEVKIPNNLDNADILFRELEGYEVRINNNGVMTYGNNTLSKHDDTVIALALSVQGLNNFINPTTNANMEEEIIPIWDENNPIWSN